MSIQQVRMIDHGKDWPQSEGARQRYEVCLDRGRFLRAGQWVRDCEVRYFESWGLALAFVNAATAVNQRPDPTTPPSGVAEQDAEKMARAA